MSTFGFETLANVLDLFLELVEGVVCFCWTLDGSTTCVVTTVDSIVVEELVMTSNDESTTTGVISFSLAVSSPIAFSPFFCLREGYGGL